MVRLSDWNSSTPFEYALLLLYSFFMFSVNIFKEEISLNLLLNSTQLADTWSRTGTAINMDDEILDFLVFLDQEITLRSSLSAIGEVKHGFLLAILSRFWMAIFHAKIAIFRKSCRIGEAAPEALQRFFSTIPAAIFCPLTSYVVKFQHITAGVTATSI